MSVDKLFTLILNSSAHKAIEAATPIIRIAALNNRQHFFISRVY